MEVYRKLHVRERLQSLTDYEIETEEQLHFQKKWIIIHSIFMLFVSIISILLLQRKSDDVNWYYRTYDDTHMNYQCCYSLWVSEYDERNNHRIEWSPCKSHGYSLNLNQTCNINGTDYCTSTSDIYVNPNKLSYNSEFMFYSFPKNYPYYGILAVVMVTYYELLLFMTCCTKQLIRSQFFAANLSSIMFIYYSYIKLYQYVNVPKQNCDNPPPMIENDCYESIISNGWDTTLYVFVCFGVIYFTYCTFAPCTYILCRCCGCYYKYCQNVVFFLAHILNVLMIIIGPISMVISYIILMYMSIKFGNNFGVITHDGSIADKIMVIIIAHILLLLAFDMFFLKSCRQDVLKIFVKSKPEKYIESIDVLSQSPTTVERE
eukprot:41594_1